MLPSTDRRPRRPRPRRRGATLAELMIYMSLLMLLTGGLYLFLVGGLGYLQKSSTFQGVQRQALLGLTAIVRDLAQSNFDYAFYKNDPDPLPHLIFLSPDQPLNSATPDAPYTLNTDGTPKFLQWVAYWLDPATQRLYRAYDTSSGGQLPTFLPPSGALTYPTMANMQAVATSQQRVVAHNIYSLECDLVSNYPGEIVVQIYALDVQGHWTTSSAPNTTVQYSTHVMLNN